jgi:hypothetical protein
VLDCPDERVLFQHVYRAPPLPPETGERPQEADVMSGREVVHDQQDAQSRAVSHGIAHGGRRLHLASAAPASNPAVNGGGDQHEGRELSTQRLGDGSQTRLRSQARLASAP